MSRKSATPHYIARTMLPARPRTIQFTPTRHHYRCDQCRRVRVLSEEWLASRRGVFCVSEPNTYPRVCRSCWAGVDIPAESSAAFGP